MKHLKIHIDLIIFPVERRGESAETNKSKRKNPGKCTRWRPCLIFPITPKYTSIHHRYDHLLKQKYVIVIIGAVIC